MTTFFIWLVGGLMLLAVASLFYPVNQPEPRQSLEERNNLLKYSKYWESWTGSRFERIENPIAAMTNREYMRSEWSTPQELRKPAFTHEVVRSCPVTGNWKVL